MPVAFLPYQSVAFSFMERKTALWRTSSSPPLISKALTFTPRLWLKNWRISYLRNVCFYCFPLTYLHLPLIKPNAQVQATRHQPYDEISLRLMWLTPNSNSLRFLSLKRTAVLSGPKLQFRWSVIIKFQCWNRSTVNTNPSASLQLTSVHFRHMAGRGPVLNCT